jgi:hypothetical protein
VGAQSAGNFSKKKLSLTIIIMKIVFLIFAVLLLKMFSVNAQKFSDHTIGLRFNQVNRLGTDFSYQRKTTPNNRLKVNVGLRDKFSRFKGTGMYQWV